MCVHAPFYDSCRLNRMRSSTFRSHYPGSRADAKFTKFGNLHCFCNLEPSLESLALEKQSITAIGATLIANIEDPEITTPLQATCFESIIEKIKMVCSAICSWITGSSPDDAHSSPKTKLSQNRDSIIQIHSNSKDALFSRSANHDTQETGSPTHAGSPMHDGYRLLPSG